MDARVDQTDYEFTSKFYEYKNEAQGEIVCNFPVPENRNLVNFFESAAGSQFIVGSKKVIMSIRDWCLKEDIAVESLDIFARRYFDLSAATEDDLKVRKELYNEAVPTLVHIENLLHHPQITNKKQVITKMLTGIEVCAAGTCTNISIAHDELLSEINLAHALMKIRKSIVEQFVLEEFRKSSARNNIGMQIHYVNVVLYHFREILHIDIAYDAMSDLCNRDVLNGLANKVLLSLPELLSLDKIMEAVVQLTDYEILIDNIKRNGYAATNEFAEKLNNYGKEINLHFLQMNDVIESKDDYQTFQLCWSASFVIYASLFYRLVESDYLKINLQHKVVSAVEYFYLEDESLKFAYVVDKKDPDGKVHQPMLVYLAKQLAINPALLVKLTTNKSFLGFDQCLEMVNACISYYQSLNEQEQNNIYNNLVCLIKNKLDIHQLLTLKQGVFLQRYLANMPFEQMTGYLQHTTHLTELLSAMDRATACQLMYYLFEKKSSIVMGFQILVMAARYGLEEIVETILLSAPRDRRQLNLNTNALQSACENGHKLVVAKLLANQHVDIDCDCGGGMRMLHFAIIGCYPSVVELLIEFGANVNLCNFLGETPLYLAVKRRSLHLVKLLLQAGAIVGSAPNKESLVALAIKTGQFDVAVWLVRVSYPSNLKGIRLIGEALLHQLVLKNDLDTITKVVRSVDKADLSCFNDDGESPLYLAVAHKRYEAAKLLLAAGCDPDDGASCEDKFPIVAAVTNKDINMFFLLLRYRANYIFAVNGEEFSSIIKKRGIPGMNRVLQIQSIYLAFAKMDDIHHDAFDRFRQIVLTSDVNHHLHAVFFNALRYINNLKEDANTDFNLSDLRNTVLHALHHYIKCGEVRADFVSLLRFKCTCYKIAMQNIPVSTLIYRFFYKDEVTPVMMETVNSAIEKLDEFTYHLDLQRPAIESTTKKRRMSDV